MIEMTQAEVDEIVVVATQVTEANDPGVAWQTHVLARAVLHLAERDRQNTAIIELGVLAVADAEERCAVKLAEAQAEIARLAARQMPALRWEGVTLCLGKLELGYVEAVWMGKVAGTVYRAIVNGLDYTDHATESEARTAVEAAVRKELGARRIEDRE